LNLTRKDHQAKRRKEGKNYTPEEHEGMPHSSISTALLKSVVKIGAQSAMKSSRKT
jgi:hypothetical protein